MKTITDKEADQWIAGMKPEAIRKIVQEYHALKQGLCDRVLLVPTGADDWVDRAIAAGGRIKECELQLRKFVNTVETACIDARFGVQGTTCTSCMGSGVVSDNSCCSCAGTGIRRLS